MHYDFLYFRACQIPTSQFNIEYAKNNQDWINASKSFKDWAVKGDIPKIIHFIWVGSDVPGWYKYNINNWKKSLPDFQFMIWRDSECEELMKSSINKDIYKNTNNFGMMSDLLRYEILFNYGGLYMDTDFVCVRPELLRFVHENSLFYTSAMLDLDLLLTNGFIGCEKYSPFMGDILGSISNRVNAYNHIQCKFTKILYQTGPHAVTDSIKKLLCPGVRIMPSKMIFPFPGALRNDGLDSEQIGSYFDDLTMACHLWHTSWQGQTKGYMGEIESFKRIF